MGAGRLMSELPERLLCIDGNCTGTLNERGYCNVCGKSLYGKHDPLRVARSILSELDLREAAAFWELELLPSEDLPEIAVSALEKGYNSPSLRILAGEIERIASTVGPLFVRALYELGISLPDVASAQMTVARFYARKIVDGSMSPNQGARHIWWDVQFKAHSTQKENEVGKRLEIFVGLASEYEDSQRRKRYKKEIEKNIIQEAKKLLSES
jgi:hypothetical protein